MDLFLCPVCQQRLVKPVTLSCGFTVCRHCIPPPTDNIPVFACPVRYCHTPTHLFGRLQDTHTDSVVDRLLQSGAGAAGFNDEGLADPSRMADKKEIMKCRKCSDTLHDPVTNHCGHVYCRTCLLMLKIEGASCLICQQPLPHYNYIQHQAGLNRLLQYHLGKSKLNQAPVVHPYRHCRSSMFVADLVILPLQHVHIPVFTTAHLRMLRQAIFRSGSSLSLPAIHRGLPSLAEYGTIVEIIGVEQRSENAIILDVVGRERFRVTRQIGDAGDGDVLMVEYHRVPAMGMAIDIPSCTTVAQAIHAYICQLAVAQPAPHILSTSTTGLLGLSWFDSMEETHGSLPPPQRPDALAWWVAIVLPVSSQERYGLLETESLEDRLNMVLSLISALSSRWHSWRQTAINSYSNAFSPQPTQPPAPL